MRKRRYKYAVWKGALRQAQGPGFSCGTVSEPAELAVKLRDRGSFATVGELAELAIKFKEGQNMKAQGNALGKWPNKIPSPERATYTNIGHRPRYTIRRPSQP